MRITLLNFKCWSNNTFELGGDGIMLITGKSGQGKTSILDAIYFALFGQGKKFTTFGKRSSSVCLEYKEYKITRTRCPNRLVVCKNNIQYEDKVGQGVINKYFGDEQCYFKKSFLLLGPLDKLGFLEKLVFKHLNIDQLKKKVKILLQNREHELLSLDAKHSTMQTILGEKQSQIRNVAKPTNNNQKTLIKKCQKRIDNYRERIRALYKQITATKVYEKFLDSYNSSFSEINENEDVSEDVKKWKILLQENILYKKYKKYLTIKKILWVENSIEECEELIEDFKQYLYDINLVRKLDEKINLLEFYDNYEEMKLQVKIKVECPLCNNFLFFDDVNNELQEIKSEINLEINSEIKCDYNKKIKTHEKNLETQRVLVERRLEITSNYEEFNVDEKSLIKSQLHDIKKYYQKHLTMQCEKVEKVEKGEHDREYIEEMIEKLIRKQAKFENSKKLREKLKQQKKIEDENFTYKKVSIQKLEIRIKEHLEKILELEQKMDLYRVQIEESKIYEANEKLLSECNNYTDSVKKYASAQVHERTKIKNSLLLKNLIQQAESIAISNIIHSLNIFAQNYLDIFFPVNPISVTINAFKQSKNKRKAQINVCVTFKGVECDLQTLSDGELQRVKVAFSLAFGEMYQTPFILLDECTSNLDQEMTEIVVGGMRQYPGKIILIAHQVVMGKFDNVIKV